MFQSVLSPKVDMHPLILTNDNTGREADHLLSISEPIAYKDANPFEAFSGPWPPSSPFYKLLEIEVLAHFW
jgi:hypothetical protein